MQNLLNLYHNKDALHHAYFIVGHKIDETIHHLFHFLENKVGIKVSGNPDFLHKKIHTFTIEHARELKEEQNKKSISGGKKIFIIEADFITEEAQNSLLKVFEEPTEGTHFFIISPQNILLPTLLSRMVVISETGDIVSPKETISKILSMEIKERIEKVKEITDSISDEEGTKQDAINFVNQIELELRLDGLEENIKKLKMCEFARNSLYDRGAPVKMILENLVISV